MTGRAVQPQLSAGFPFFAVTISARIGLPVTVQGVLVSKVFLRVGYSQGAPARPFGEHLGCHAGEGVLLVDDDGNAHFGG